jgi:RIO kinase 1
MSTRKTHPHLTAVHTSAPNPVEPTTSVEPDDLDDSDDLDDTPWYDDDPDDSDADPYQDFQDRWAESGSGRAPRRRRPSGPVGLRLVGEGRSGHQTSDRDADDLASAAPGRGESPFSSYDVATHGPDPVPDWLITGLSARDTPLGVVKTGKEADVALLDRSEPDGPGCLLAVKTYRDSTHRQFHRDAEYLEGRRVRRSRETRALEARSRFGRELLAGRWAGAEFAALSTLWLAGARVPYPVQLLGSELMMEFIGTPDGVAAPRLAETELGTDELTDLWQDLVMTLEMMAERGLVHGDLSPYNVLVHENRCVIIDLPQMVDLVANPQGRRFLQRDCVNVATFFARRGVRADGEVLAGHLAALSR